MVGVVNPISRPQRLSSIPLPLFLSENAKKKRKIINGKDWTSSRKLEIPREHFMQRWAQ